jgi:non-canonical purine NTP pyrophosphatase (RdgB/HAM1 family)
VTDFVLATANPDKAREIAKILGPTVRLLRRPDWVGDVAETGDTLLENARLKARAVAEATNRPAIADDTGLEVDDLGGQPGVRSARFAGEQATYEDNVAKLISTMAGSNGHRLARFRTVAVAAWPDGREVVGEGVVSGVISKEPRGRSGFGYDPVFVPDEGDGRTFAEMSLEEKNVLSHRGRAFRDLEGLLAGFDGAAVDGATVDDGATVAAAAPQDGAPPDQDEGILPSGAEPESEAAGAVGTTRTDGTDRRALIRDILLAAVLGIAVLVVHDVGYMLRHPFWIDESWVADSVRARIGLAPTLSSATPLGWTVLLRLVPWGGFEKLRLVPLGFTVLAAVAGYWLGRELRLSRYLTGVLTGAAVLLAPAMLLRDDLKQYTAEAFATVLVLVLVARIENEWTTRRLLVLAGVVAAGLFFANTVIFVGAAAMGGLALECLIRRRYRRLLEVAGVSAAMLAASLVIYELVDRAHVTSSITSFWNGYYIPRNQGISGAWRYVDLRLHQLAPYLGFRSLALDGLLILAGIVALILLKRYALAAMFPLTMLAMAVASADRKYPFGDMRTSTFWLVMGPILMAIAVAAAAQAIPRYSRPAALVAAAVALAIWVPVAHPYIRAHPIPNEDVRSQVEYLNARLKPADVVIVDYGASFGFAYYEHEVSPVFVADNVPSNGFLPSYPKDTWVVQMPNRRAQDVTTALATAKAKLAARGGRGRIWIVRSHLVPAEVGAWSRELAGQDVQTIRVGPEALLLYQPPSPGAA